MPERPLVRVIVRLKYWLITAIIVACMLASLLAEPKSAQEVHAWSWALAAKSLAEVAAALVGALATIFLLDETNKAELRANISEQLGRELARFEFVRSEFVDRQNSLRGEIDSELASLKLLREKFLQDMQDSVLRYRLFDHTPDKEIIRQLKDRIFTKPLIRESQEITCTVEAEESDDRIVMRFDYIIRYRNLAASMDTTNSFRLALHESVLTSADGAGTVQSLSVAEIPPGSSTPSARHIIDGANVRIEPPSGAPRDFTFTVAGHNDLFHIKGGYGAEWRFTYVTRQRRVSSEPFVVRDLTKRFTFNVNRGSFALSCFTFRPLADDDTGQREDSPFTSTYVISDLLLPRQGVSFSWDCSQRSQFAAQRVI